MSFGLLARSRQFAGRRINQLTRAGRRLRMSALMAAAEVQHSLTERPRVLMQRLSLRQLIAACTLAALVLTPSVLYLIERSRRQAEEHAYQTLALASAAETGYLKSSVSNLLAERARLTDVLLDAGYSIRTGDNTVVKVVATGYSSSVYETDNTPFITASNTQTRDGILALSRDLLKRYNPDAPFAFGDRVHVAGLGEFIVEDSMHSRWNNRIDVWFPSRLEAIRFGVKEVYLRTVNEDLTGPNVLTERDPDPDPSGM